MKQRSPKGTKMAETSGSIDPFAAFKFILSVDGMLAGFAEVEGLTSETDIIDYREGSEDPRSVDSSAYENSPTSSSGEASPTVRISGIGTGRPSKGRRSACAALSRCSTRAASPSWSGSSCKFGPANGADQRSTTRKSPSTRWSLWWRRTFQLR